MKTNFIALILSTALVAGLSGCSTTEAPVQTAAVPEKPHAPVLRNSAKHNHPITTSSPTAQTYFNQGLGLVYGFNHTEAIRSFEAAVIADPKSAMAQWGIAYAYGPHINGPMNREAGLKAWAALQKAIELKPNASKKEQAYIDALAKRYRAEPPDDRAALDMDYADAMREVSKQFPDDMDAATLFAEALMNTMPWDYWTKDLTPKPATEELLTTLRTILLRDPKHPGANHFQIHAVEAGPNPELGLPSADTLKDSDTDAGHLVHMPSHIYVRLGQYDEATKANRRAIAVDKAYIRQCRAQGFYPGVYYPHNIHFLWFSTSLEGHSKESIEAAKTVATYAAEAQCGPTKVLEAPRFRHLPLLAYARFGKWDEILNTPPLPSEFAFDKAMSHYARSIAFLNKGKLEEAIAEQAALKKIAASEEIKKMNSPQFPANGALSVAQHLLAGKISGKKGDSKTMIQELAEAVAAQDELPYMEPPYWYYPTRESLGAALLQSGDAEKAAVIFRENLEDFPRSGWSLFGLQKSLDKQGRLAEAASVEKEFQKAWQRADTSLDLSWY